MISELDVFAVTLLAVGETGLTSPQIMHAEAPRWSVRQWRYALQKAVKSGLMVRRGRYYRLAPDNLAIEIIKRSYDLID